MKYSRTDYTRSALILVFVLSGFSGLIYESIWTHYLKLFLGHAAYAQTLVLAIFMGGMAIGAWICSQRSLKWRNQLKAYALVEGVIGVAALIFHPSFDALINISYQTLMPGMQSSMMVTLYKWTVSAALILPQSILLGMTFPLMSTGLLRRYPQQPGGTLSTLYFANSIGASVGVLVSGFVLIAWIGLPGTISLAGVINIVLAASVWMLIQGQAQEVVFHVRQDVQVKQPSSDGSYRLFLTIAFVTGAASFIYEVSWIRMLNLVLSSSTHAFELMLSVFILGLALGSLWIRKRIDLLKNVIFTLALVQLVMGLFALATLPVYNQTFDIMQWLMQTVARDAEGYVLFNLASHAIAGAVMLPATFCAGMTLPLITYRLLRSGYGEKSIGSVYAFNTLGAIIGVVFAIHIGMPTLGLKGLLSFAAALDIGLALLLGWLLYKADKHPFIKPAMVVGLLSLGAVTLLVNLNPYKMASGVYRHGLLFSPDHNDILYHKDGKSASIDLIRSKASGNVTISTNGKPDATVNMSNIGPASPDEATMILVGAIPLALHPAATNAGVIGMGSGLSTQALLAANNIARVDTVEIEAAIIEAANGFRPKVELAFTSPKSHITIDDAKTYFSTFNKKYDIIVSEPSNPWVSGTANLFTDEFYELIKRHLNHDGMLVQWLQLYEINVELIASVAKSLSDQFQDYIIYATDDEDIVFIAKTDSDFNPASNRVFTSPWLQFELNRLGVRSLQDLQLHVIGDKASLAPLFRSYAIANNSDYYPVLDLGAARARYFQEHAGELVRLMDSEIPVVKFLSPHYAGLNTQGIEPTTVTPNPYIKVSDAVFAATLLRDFVLNNRVDRQYPRIDADTRLHTEQVKQTFIDCQQSPPADWLASLYGFARATTPYLNHHELNQIWSRIVGASCFVSLTGEQQQWIHFFRAVATADVQGMITVGDGLLAKPIDNPQFARYVVLGQALGLIKNNNKPRAAVVLKTHSQLLDRENNLLDRLVYSHSLEK